MASPSSSVILESKYDVFLSFRGKDTRLNFTSHLHAALCRQNVATFIDSKKLRIGDKISPVLLKAIEDSKVSVIIFSKNYASSSWCLEELEKILQCMKSKGQIVVPVFYHIDPSEVRHQIGSFEKSFGKHDARFKNMPGKVQIWRAALTEAANISGKHLAENKPESELVEEIVRDILNRLTDMSPLSVIHNDLVGIDRHIKRINSLLKESNVVGIWGMVGIGKTTIVQALFNQISRDFDSCCFINVGKQLEKHHDQLVDLQRKIISRILREGDCNIDIPNAIPQLTKERLRRKKFLIVLDDVNNFEHLEFLVKGLEPLHIKSRIIIISRNKQVLSCCEENHIYEVEGLNYDEAPLLFYKYAFKECRVPEHLQQLSKTIITYAKGHPLALKVLGSSLHGKSKKAWESVVFSVKEIIDPQILDVLKISYDGLTDTQKSMFLFIASFLNWESKVVAEKILKAYFKPMEYCFEVLINKALIKTSNNRLQMHDLLLEMGREIVRKEYEYKPEECRRLLDKDDVRHVLQNNKFSSMASSSSSVILQSKHDVFLSFRGEDTRHSFTSHLYSALIKEDIAPFIDADGLKPEAEILPVLLKAIQDSKISVIIFSQMYASSRWCLDELSNIVECRKSRGQVVIPVFYRIDPSDVRKQTGIFGEAFDMLHKRFAGTPERVHKWRAALTEAANLSGDHLTENRSESKLIEEIVRDIRKILTNMSPLSDNYDDLVGIDRRITQINWLLKKSSIVGIWGMRGIGKTTIVEALCKQISRDFDSCCFINFGKQLEKHHDRLVDLQREIISRILGEGNNVIEISNAIPQLTKERLRRKKFIIVLDDVNNFEHLKFLIKGLQPLHEKSRIIITTRDKQVLSCEGNKTYEVEGLIYDEAPLLFYKYAFKEYRAPEQLQQLSEMIIAYAKGNPLALKVLGSFLYRKSKEAWESVVHNLEEIADVKILDILKVSYIGLDNTEKSMFLDIACFLNWESQDVAKKILKACYKPMEYHFKVLINKALIETSNKKLQMHDLLQEMGREIVLKECQDNPGKRNRLWDEDDVRHVLQNNEGTGVVEGIFLDISRLREEIHLSSKAFVKMPNLRVLKLYWSGSYSEDYANISKLRLPSVLEDLPNELRYLHWDGYPWDELPSKFSAKKLVELKLLGSGIQKLWDEAKNVVNLKSIDVSNSEHIIEFPSLQNAPKLETIIFEGCKRLCKFSSYIPCFTNLRFLNMRGCECLERFPTNIHFESPITLDFKYCINLTEFPEVSGNVEHLNLAWTAIEEIPASIECLTELVTLTMYCCKKLKSISPNICKLSSLSELNLVDCFKLESFPEIVEEMKCLKRLELSGTAIKELPSSIKHLAGLTHLGLSTTLEAIPSSISKLSTTAASEYPLSLRLKYLLLRGHDFEILPTSIKQLSKLRIFVISNCNMLQSIPELPLRIESLSVNNCKQLRSLPQLPSNIEQCDEDESTFPYIVEFRFENCVNLTESISQERVERMAAAFGFFYKKVHDEIPEFRFLLPGGEIPEWFNHQSFGSSITIERPQQYCGSRRFIGFALSAVITAEKDHCEAFIQCCYSFGIYKEFVCVGSFDSQLIESDHIALSFCPAKGMLLEGGYSTVTFNFRVDSMGCTKLKCCGVCPIYEEPNMAQSSSSVERFAPTDERYKGDSASR